MFTCLYIAVVLCIYALGCVFTSICRVVVVAVPMCLFSFG